MRVVGDPIELVARPHPLAQDHLLLDHVSGRGCGPNEGHRIFAGEHFADMAFGNAEIAQPLLAAAGVTDAEIDLGTHDVGAVHPKQWIAGVNMLACLAHKEFFDVTVRPHGDDGQPGLVVLDGADGAHRAHDHPRLDLLGAHAAALDLVEAHLDGLAVVLLLALVDRDVVHPHPVLLRHRRGVGQAHGIAVVQNLARAAGASAAASSRRARTRFPRPRRPEASRGRRHPSSARPTNTARRSGRGSRESCARRPLP